MKAVTDSNITKEGINLNLSHVIGDLNNNLIAISKKPDLNNKNISINLIMPNQTLEVLSHQDTEITYNIQSIHNLTRELYLSSKNNN